jgi:hypothetical protein
MRINELLVESQQLDEGPFTQAIGKVGGKIAKGVSNIGKDLKTGFKAGYSGEQPPTDAAATTAPAAAAPAKKAGGGFIDQFKKGFAQGRGEPAVDTTADPAATTSAPAADAKPVATTPPPAADAAPAANSEAEKAAKIGVGQINKIIPTLRTRDLMSLQANLEKTIASKKKTAPVSQPTDAASTTDPAASAADPAAATTPAVDPAADAVAKPKRTRKPKAKVAPTQAEIDADRENNPNIQMSNNSVIRTGASLSETLARKVQEQRQRMFETALMAGTQSVFKK